MRSQLMYSIGSGFGGYPRYAAYHIKGGRVFFSSTTPDKITGVFGLLAQRPHTRQSILVLHLSRGDNFTEASVKAMVF